MNTSNPLLQFIQQQEIFTRLPTDGILYDDSVISMTSSDEIGVCGRSAKDEMLFNNPDALMNGQAVSSVIANCVPRVAKPDELYIPDVEILLMAIKAASGEKEYDLEVTCPKCEKKGSFTRDIPTLLETATLLKEEPFVMIGDLKVYLQPSTWRFHNYIGNETFKIKKTMQIIDTHPDITDEKASEIMNDCFNRMTNLHYEIMITNITRVMIPCDLGEPIVVIDKNNIREWVLKLPSSDIKTILTKMEELNNMGVDKTQDVICKYCEHEWTVSDLVFDPSHFFAKCFSSQPMKK